MFGNDIRADSTENTSALRSRYRHHDAVVGNPPFITPKDAALNSTYRQLYRTPHLKYALTVPFMELFFRLAYSSGAARPAGWVGQIFQLLHKTWVRGQARREFSADHRPRVRDRHLWRLHPQPWDTHDNP